MTGLRAAEIRYRVDPADVPAEKAARRLHLTLERFSYLSGLESSVEAGREDGDREPACRDAL